MVHLNCLYPKLKVILTDWKCPSCFQYFSHLDVRPVIPTVYSKMKLTLLPKLPKNFYNLICAINAVLYSLFLYSAKFVSKYFINQFTGPYDAKRENSLEYLHKFEKNIRCCSCHFVFHEKCVVNDTRIQDRHAYLCSTCKDLSFADLSAL